MVDKHNKMTREERLAAKLRENLRRRKTQARQIGGVSKDSSEETLSKPPAES